MTCGTEYDKQVEARRLSGGKNKVRESYKPEDTHLIEKSLLF